MRGIRRGLTTIGSESEPDIHYSHLTTLFQTQVVTLTFVVSLAPYAHAACPAPPVIDAARGELTIFQSLVAGQSLHHIMKAAVLQEKVMAR